MTAGLLMAVVIGLSLGILGGGGSILTVPVFVYVMGFGVKGAIAMSLALVGVTSLFGAVGHWRSGNVNLRAAAVFGAVAMGGTYLGARVAVFFSGPAQLILFALVMFAASYVMFRNGRGSGAAGENGRMNLALVMLAGVAVGVLTGLVGVGGGFMIVPALVLLGGVDMKEAVGTSLLVIALNSAAGFVGYLGRVEIHWGVLTAFTLVAITGSLAGSYLVRFIPEKALGRGFSVFLVVMGAFILFENRGAFF
ncbi:MAG TPA: sulfite exporter TauE/SafE family protein [Rubrobacteraceae bacterium]|nr:sulfite exporter TauE/SafE family protein [Rubrobacteraceae bacterium]